MKAKLKLMEARKNRRRSPHKKDEFELLIERQRTRSTRGIPPDLPKMKPWDYAKAKINHTPPA